jgi:hypothetical protein
MPQRLMIDTSASFCLKNLFGLGLCAFRVDTSTWLLLLSIFFDTLRNLCELSQWLLKKIPFQADVLEHFTASHLPA